jgi:hypothetical protein
LVCRAYADFKTLHPTIEMGPRSPGEDSDTEEEQS